MKKSVVWVIDSMGRGGAEILLMDLLPDLKRTFDIYLVILSSEIEFEEILIRTYVKDLFIIERKGKFPFFKQYFSLRKILLKINPDIIRSQLLYSNMLSRLAAPKGSKLFFSIHSTLSLDSFDKSNKMLILEKLIYKKNHTLIAVSNEVLKDYKNSVGIKGKSFVLKNYVSKEFLNYPKLNYRDDIKKIACVGNLKEVKNYQLIIDAFVEKAEVREFFEVHIYGDGNLKSGLQSQIDKHKLPIVLKGKINNVYEILNEYDAYMLPSLHEGFGIAVAEAMLVGLPVIASDLKVLHETTHDNAIFFNPLSVHSLIAVLMRLRNFKKEDFFILQKQTKRAKEIAEQYYLKDRYMSELINIYEN